MNIYDVTKSPFPVFDQGLTMRNEVNHRNFNFGGATQEKKQLLQTKASKAGVPYELWLKEQVPWTSFRQSAEFNSEKSGAEKSVFASKKVGNTQKEDREAIHFSKYVDQSFGELIGTTAEGLMDWYRENVISKRKPSLQETDPIEYHYRVFGGRGQKLYYWKGKNYTYEEFYPIDLQEARKAFARARALVEGN